MDDPTGSTPKDGPSGHEVAQAPKKAGVFAEPPHPQRTLNDHHQVLYLQIGRVATPRSDTPPIAKVCRYAPKPLNYPPLLKNDYNPYQQTNQQRGNDQESNRPLWRMKFPRTTGLATSYLLGHECMALSALFWHRRILLHRSCACTWW